MTRRYRRLQRRTCASSRRRPSGSSPSTAVIWGIGAAQEHLLAAIIAESRAWLISEGAVNPLPAALES
jgi:hypothetical protein